MGILKKNPLKNYRVMVRLNPHAKHAKKQAKHVEVTRLRAKEELMNKKRGITKPLEPLPKGKSALRKSKKVAKEQHLRRLPKLQKPRNKLNFDPFYKKNKIL